MEDIEWSYESRRIDELKENVDNPRRLSKKRSDELKKSIDKFGFCKPIVIQPDGKIIGGHQRVKTLRAFGYDKVAVAIPSRVLSDKEAKELTIGLNKIKGEFDLDMLANIWEMDILIAGGFTEEELHTDVVPQEKPKKFSINIKFDNEDDLRHIGKELLPMIDLFPAAKMKVRVA